MGRTAIIFGATGLIGDILLQKLIDDEAYEKITVVARRPLTLKHEKIYFVETDFDNLENHSAQIVGDDIFCCIGTIQKNTPDLKIYRKIDYQYPLDFAAIGLKNGSSSYNLISSMSANANSRFFYTKLKGELERDLSKMFFKTINIYRPSLLDGERTGTRTAENFFIKAMRFLNPLLIGPLKKYRSIKAEIVARAMLQEAKKESPGIHIFQSDQIADFGEK
ncbi:uncharacterized protein YbjT (DUF2867 family) [Pedobacter sp. UYEF25]